MADFLRPLYITRDKDSIDSDKLTHIVLFKYDETKDPMRVVDFRAFRQLQEQYGQLAKEYNELKSRYDELKKALIETRNTRG